VRPPAHRWDDRPGVVVLNGGTGLIGGKAVQIPFTGRRTSMLIIAEGTITVRSLTKSAAPQPPGSGR